MWLLGIIATNKGQLISKSIDGSVYQTLNFELPNGNQNVMQIDMSLSFSLLGFVNCKDFI